MLRPFLIVGVGGSGGKTLRGLKHQLELKLQQVGWRDGIPDAWQLLHVDTPTAQDGQDFPLPFLPPQNYRGLVTVGSTYETVAGSIGRGNRLPASIAKDVNRTLPDPREVKVDVTIGAGQYRAVGRAVVLSAPSGVADAVSAAVGRMTDAKAVAQLRTLGAKIGATDGGGESVNPMGIIVSSIAGGSGAGQFLDVAQIVKSSIQTSSNANWADQLFGLLYAPDVFDQIKINPGMPGNALAAISETINGFWTRTPSASTIQLFNSRGLAPSYGKASDNVGVAYPFVVGRGNSKVTFADQGEVYSAIATSLTAWITDDHVQDSLAAYTQGNWASRVGADVLPDSSQLLTRPDNAPPFASIGFGRVALGRDKFQEYSAERLARSAVDRMLFAHTESDPKFEQRTEAEWILSKANGAYKRFITDLKLDEATEDNNDVIDDLRAADELEVLKTSLRAEVAAQVSDSAGLDKLGGLDINIWRDRIITANSQFRPKFIAEDARNRETRLENWIATQPDHILRTVGEYIGQYGLPVVTEMLRMLSIEVGSAAEGLVAESRTRESWLVSTLDQNVAAALGEAANQSSIRPDQDAVQSALDWIPESLVWASESQLRTSAATLLDDLRVNFLDPLRLHLEGSLVELRGRVSAQFTSDGRENEFKHWPTRSDSTVPRKYTPAPNEALLVPHSTFPSEFAGLVSSTMGGAKFDDAMLLVVTEVLVGPAPDDARIAKDKRWSLIESPRTWVPAIALGKSAKTPQFSFAGDPEVYVDRAQLWMARQGTAFDAYNTEDFGSYFDPSHLTPDVYASRRDAFREAFTTALGSSEPLVRLNSSLLREVHDKSLTEGASITFSSIPFRQGTEMYEITKSVLAGQHLWDDSTSERWFQDATVNSIQAFGLSGFPYEPIVMQSVMEPISKVWMAQANTIESRSAFWLWKRSRLLGESVPADPKKVGAMLRGWYVAKALGLLKVTNSEDERGPKIEVWDANARNYASFPHPLLYPGIAPGHDYPGIALESLIIAVALCTSVGSLEPLRAYQALIELGGTTTGLSTVLQNWVQSGTSPASGPVPNAKRAGSTGDTMSTRQESLRDYFDSEVDDFKLNIVDQDPGTSVYDYPVSWEVRDAILAGVEDLRSRVLAVRPITDEYV
jgi:hypothetical protein